MSGAVPLPAIVAGVIATLAILGAMAWAALLPAIVGYGAGDGW